VGRPAARPRRARPGQPLAARLARAHPWRWLRVLRNVTLAMIVVAGLLCLLVSYQAHREMVTATGNGAQAISEVIAANSAINQATNALQKISPSAVVLSGPGGQYTDSYTSATKQLTLVALDNVAGSGAATGISFAGGLLVSYDGQARQAIADYAEGQAALGKIQVKYYLPSLKVGTALETLLQTEQAATAQDLNSWWLSPGDVRLLLLAPLFVLLLAAAGTSYQLWRGFRRLFSVRLAAAAAATLALVVIVAALNVHDEEGAHAFMTPMLKASISAHTLTATGPGPGLAYSPLTLVVGLLLAAAASAAAYAAYRPRLEEYRYRA
jgi:hypothetical protein